VNANQPVALIDDGELLDEVLKLAAATGADVERVPDAAALRQRWGSAPLVILDCAAARETQSLRLVKRPGVLVVCTTKPTVDFWERAVLLGTEQVIELPGGESTLIAALADVVEAPASAMGKVLAVVGGRGGAGASVFAASVGLTVLRGGDNALLIDCDPLGGGLDLVLGAEAESGLRWPDLRLREGRVAASALHSSLPGRTRGRARLTMLSGAREGSGPEPDAVAAVLEAGRRAGETVICDLARPLDDAAYAVLDRTDLTVIVVPAEVRACVAAKSIAARLTSRGDTTKLIVRGPAPGGLRPEHIADTIGLPILASMRPEPCLARSLERGEFRPRPKGPLDVAAKATLRVLAALPSRDLRKAS
jgi:secretion/DNA translocation related CpaE-like protein